MTLRDIQNLEKQGKIRGFKAIGGGAATQLSAEKVEKKAKYRNKRCMYNGIAFDSKKEMCRFADLLFLQEQGLIHFLNIQVRFNLSVCTYIADMVYFENGELVCEDVKSAMTRKLPTYRLKFKMMQNELGITIKEV